MILQTAYVSGPMRGLKYYNFPAFDECAAYLRTLDFVVLNPAEHDREGGFDETKASLDDFDMHAAFRWDVEAVLRSDLVVCLPGWEKSTGANLEVSNARAVGLPVWQYNPEGTTNAMRLRVLFAVGDAAEAELSSPLEEALKLVHGARQESYGHPIDDFTRTGRLWGAILADWARDPSQPIDPALVGLCMVAVKISREVNSPKYDNLVDLAGYAETVHLVRQAQA